MSSDTEIKNFEAWADTKGGRDEAPPFLSVVVPAYNEYRRLPVTLMEMIDLLDLPETKAVIPAYEIIVVDDGSSDETDQIVRKFERVRSQIRLVRLAENSGKGFAVKSGMRNARGEVLMFADADGATPFSEVLKLVPILKEGADVVIGSRAIYAKDTKVSTSWYRKYIGRIFNLMVNLLVLPDIADTQCGFKLFSKRAATYIFDKAQRPGFSFDVELLFLARRGGFVTREIPINWKNVPGSKVNLITDSVRMLIDIFLIRMQHAGVGHEKS